MAFQIKTYQPSAEKCKALVYGPSGSGKTLFAAKADDCVFITSEQGLLSTRHIAQEKNIDYITIEPKASANKDVFDQVEEIMTQLDGKDGSKYKTIVIDSLTDVVDMYVQDLLGSSSTRKTTQLQLQEYGMIATRVQQFLSWVRFKVRNKHVLVICQEGSEELTEYVDESGNTRTGSFTSYHPSIVGKKSKDKLPYIFDICARCVRPKSTDKNQSSWFSATPDIFQIGKDRIGIGKKQYDSFQEWISMIESIGYKEQKVIAEVKSDSDITKEQFDQIKTLAKKLYPTDTAASLQRIITAFFKTNASVESLSREDAETLIEKMSIRLEEHSSNQPSNETDSPQG